MCVTPSPRITIRYDCVSLLKHTWGIYATLAFRIYVALLTVALTGRWRQPRVKVLPASESGGAFAPEPRVRQRNAPTGGRRHPLRGLRRVRRPVERLRLAAEQRDLQFQEHRLQLQQVVALAKPAHHEVVAGRLVRSEEASELVLEVLVKGLLRDARSADDVIDRGGGVALLSHRPAGRLEQARALRRGHERGVEPVGPTG